MFFSSWTGQSGAGCLLYYGGDLLPPWEVIRGAAWGAQATLCIPSNPAALAPCAELVFVCAWHMAVPGTRGLWCGAVVVAVPVEQGCWGSVPVFSPGSVSFCSHR